MRMKVTSFRLVGTPQRRAAATSLPAAYDALTAAMTAHAAAVAQLRYARSQVRTANAQCRQAINAMANCFRVRQGIIDTITRLEGPLSAPAAA